MLELTFFFDVIFSLCVCAHSHSHSHVGHNHRGIIIINNISRVRYQLYY